MEHKLTEFMVREVNYILEEEGYIFSIKMGRR